MKNKYRIIIVIVVIVTALLLITRLTRKKHNGSEIKIIHPVIGNVTLTITTTGVVEPQNRLEIKPSIGGRVEEILVEEGDYVKTGDVLAWMSSTERAALVDIARSQGKEALEYWEKIYKKTPIISPINGEVIVRSVEPGQTIVTSEIILVLSNRLVVNAQFDETDIGRVKIGQKALITLDAYPEVRLQGIVDHIAYESEIVNNVTIYDVDILPDEIPEFLRSGMSITVEIIEKTNNNVITIPASALHYDEKQQFVLLKEGRSDNIIRRNVTVGLNNDTSAEIISGLSIEDNVVMQDNAYLPKKKDSGTNPFMPFGGRKK